MCLFVGRMLAWFEQCPIARNVRTYLTASITRAGSLGETLDTTYPLPSIHPGSQARPECWRPGVQALCLQCCIVSSDLPLLGGRQFCRFMRVSPQRASVYRAPLLRVRMPKIADVPPSKAARSVGLNARGQPTIPKPARRSVGKDRSKHARTVGQQVARLVAPVALVILLSSFF